jgi:hypothetical protein
MTRRALYYPFFAIVLCALVTRLCPDTVTADEDGHHTAGLRLKVQEHTITQIGKTEIDCRRVGQRLRVRLTNQGPETVFYETSRLGAKPRPEDIDLFVWSGGFNVYPMRTSGTFWFFGQEPLLPGASIEAVLWDCHWKLRELESGTPYFLGIRVQEKGESKMAWTGRSGWPLLSDKEMVRDLVLDSNQPGIVSSKLRNEDVSEMRILRLLTTERAIPIRDALPHTRLHPERKEALLRLHR